MPQIVLHEKEDEEWHIARGKPYCGDCFREKEAKKAARQAKAADKEAAAAAVDELSGGLITDESTCELLWRRDNAGDAAVGVGPATR